MKLTLKAHPSDMQVHHLHLDNTFQLYYSKTEVNELCETLIDAAPIALNQFSELAAALDNDANYASNVNTLIATNAIKVLTLLA